MKRLFSLTLFLCSFTLCAAAAQAQTWRLTNDAYSDSLPKITIDNAGRAWVAWLSKAPGNYDVYYRKYEGSVWGDTFSIYSDCVDQYGCAIANDSINDRVWFAWDRRVENDQGMFRGFVHGAYFHSDSMVNLGIVVDTVNSCDGGAGLLLAAGDSGKMYLSWTSDSNSAARDGMIRSYRSATWNDVKKIFPGYDGGMLGGLSAKSVDITSDGNTSPLVLGYSNGGSMGGFSYADILYANWNADSIKWLVYPVDSWTGTIGNSNQAPTAIAIQWKDDQLLAIYCANTTSDSNSLKCNIINLASFTLDTSFIIKTHCGIQSGAMAGSIRPTLAWSDSHSIFLNTYYDTMWSRPPVRISDETLANCINPDIVAENDSTVWVCYQNDGDIYVTRTSVPLGVSEKPITQIQNPQPKKSLKSWPNPASNVIHFACTLPVKRNSSVSIYDIAGRLVKNLEIRGDQINWNCADNAGRRVASGVYFARLQSGGQETIQRISIIK
jgi:hypothetical protein